MQQCEDLSSPGNSLQITFTTSSTNAQAAGAAHRAAQERGRPPVQALQRKKKRDLSPRGANYRPRKKRAAHSGLMQEVGISDGNGGQDGGDAEEGDAKEDERIMEL